MGSTQSGSPTAAGAQSGQSNAAGTRAGPPNAAGDRAEAARNTIPTISLSDLRRATNNFHFDEIIGGGRSALIYKGTLKIHEIDQNVAIKRLDPAANRDAAYDRELSILSRLNHTNIIKIVGCCAHRDEERIIVYEMPFRTLYQWLHVRKAGQAPLDWDTRMRIGHGVAKGLRYLHNEATPKVIFRDLKSRNVLILDESYDAKIFNFGIALSVPPGAESSTVATNEPFCTFPYGAPEATLTNYSISLKSDVFSFGVLMLEIIHGSLPIDPKRFVDEWVETRENLHRVLDPKMNGQFIDAELGKAMRLVKHCMKERPFSRPDMSVVERGMSHLAFVENVAWPEAEFKIEDNRDCCCVCL